MSVEPPFRVVDAEQNGWMAVAGKPEGLIFYTIDYDEYLTFDELRAQHGPLRPVEPITEADRTALLDALRDADEKAVYTVAVAVYRTIEQVRSDRGGTEFTHASFRQLCAGCPGSWQSLQLVAMALWAGDGTPSRIHEDAAHRIQSVLYRWITDPARYTEVAENLADVVSDHADATGGWKAVADKCLQFDSLDQEGVRLTYGLLYSFGATFDPAVIE